jgi:hypothetical protein
MDDHGGPDPIGGGIGSGQHFEIILLKGFVEVVHFEAKVRDGFDEFMDGAVVVEPHPFDAKRAGAEALDMDLQVRVIHFSGDGCFDGDAEVVEAPAQAIGHFGWLMIFTVCYLHKRIRSKRRKQRVKIKNMKFWHSKISANFLPK